MNRGFLFLPLGVILGGGLVYLVWGRGNQPPAPVADQLTSTQTSTQSASEVVSIDTAQKAESTNPEILYTASGFSPRALRVAAGTTITFNNKTNRNMWVASDPHPTHTDNPSFNQDQAGLTYSHEFNKPGIYNYHNHLRSEDRGTIFVE